MPNEGYPLWLIALIVTLGALGTFWAKIKSSLELIFKGKHAIALKKIDGENANSLKLKERILLLERENLRLTKSNVALSTAMMFIMDEYEKSNPDNTTVIENLKFMIKDTLRNEGTKD